MSVIVLVLVLAFVYVCFSVFVFACMRDGSCVCLHVFLCAFECAVSVCALKLVCVCLC